jgi:membrane-associated protease RseP (regulator of RpoE activity)
VKDTPEGALTVEKFSAGSAAQAAGMLPGDRIDTVNGSKISEAELLKMMHHSTGGDIQFKINRSGAVMDMQVTPVKAGSVSPSQRKMYEMVMLDKRKVRLAVVVADVKNYQQGKFDRKSWEDTARAKHQSAIEYGFSGLFGNTEGFSLVDRAQLDTVLEERKVYASGSVSPEVRVEIGKVTGATHVFIASLGRYSNDLFNKSCMEEYNNGLVEVESGKVLANDRQRIEACR